MASPSALAAVLDEQQAQQPAQPAWQGAMFGLSNLARGLFNPGGFGMAMAPTAQRAAQGMVQPLMQANQAMPWGGNDPSAIGIDTQAGTIDPSVMVPFATNVAGMAQTGSLASPGVAGAVGSGIRSTLPDAGGLPMDYASRMARATDQGYSYDAFKGAYPYDWRTGPTYAFKDGKWQQVDNIGARPELITEFNSPDAPYAGFFSKDVDVANRFAKAYDQGAVYPVKLKFENPVVIDGGGKPAAAFQFDAIAREHGTLDDLKRFREAFESGGHDGVIIENTLDEGTIYIPKGGSQIRSTAAAFDPAQASSPNILAVNPAPAAGIGAAVQSGQPYSTGGRF